MESLPDYFYVKANEKLKQHSELRFEWSHEDSKKILKIFKNSDDGFDIKIECETYGLYPSVDGWHGAPWDSNVMEFEDMCQDCLGFIRSLLCTDSKLIVSYSNDKPYKWVLCYPFEDDTYEDETGLFFFNYFGRKSKMDFQNHSLPPRNLK